MRTFYSYSSYVFVALLVCITACQLNNPVVNLTEDYFRIYDTNTELSYEANDIKVLNDGSYLVYGTAIADSSQGNSLVYGIPYFMKLDEFGTVEWDTTLIAFRDDRDQIKRVNNGRNRLVEIGTSYFFTAYPQDQGDNIIRLFSFDIDTKTLTSHYTFNGTTKRVEGVDLVVNPTSGGFYAATSQCSGTSTEADEVGLTYFDDSGNLIWEVALGESYMCRRVGSSEVTQPTDIYHDVGYIQTNAGEEYVYIKTVENEQVEEREFRVLFVNANTGTIEFSNVFNDVSIVFDGEGSNLQTGVPIFVYADGDDSLRLATANYTTNGEEVLYPAIEIVTGADEVEYNESEFSSNELELGTTILIEEAAIDGQQLLIYGGTTREGRILIAAFDKTSGRLINKKYFGYNSYYEIGSVRQTTDEGLIILAHTLTAGRFQQLAVIKISATRFIELLNVD